MSHKTRYVTHGLTYCHRGTYVSDVNFSGGRCSSREGRDVCVRTSDIRMRRPCLPLAQSHSSGRSLLMATLYASVWVTELPRDIREEQLAKLFEHCGQVLQVRLFCQDRINVDGLITFSSFSAARDAKIHMNGHALMGRRLR